MNPFEQNIASIYKNRGKTWLADLPEKVERIAALWELNRLHAFPNLSYNYVLEGYQKGNPIVLKISLDELSLDKEAKALTAFADFGVVEVLARTKEALLLQRAMFGNVLKNQSPKGHLDAIKIACDVAKKLHQAPLPKDNQFPHIKEWLAALDKKWNIPLFHLEKARTIKNILLKTQSTSVLLHGDLHQDNILSNGDDWLIIDPKGVIGSPINEMWAYVEDPKNDLIFISKYFDFDHNEVFQWYYVHLVLAACWQVEDNLDPSLFLDLAQSVRPMIKD
ncbi:aminoglycoside phosphotransferase family protein [Candidatus Protochlamydia sp. R18]|uniref:aminoglycoside phosphotransferase family protein n=1 Tax=Candidatus Protochlamydia sp. R18 TaxID=1353977 RepID=UPI0005A7F9A2|nr:aminoglycoside phosphotransferase family protein [Candidatus Protochlamydia sp. R18]